MPKGVQYAVAYLMLGILCAVGLLVLGIGLRAAVRQMIFVHSAISTTGKIIDMQQTRPGRSTGHRYKPEFRFTAGNGQMYFVVSSTAGSYSDFRTGQSVEVFYLSEHPETARINTFGQLWAFPVIFCALGCIVLFFPVRILRAILRQRNPAIGTTRLSAT